MKEKKMYTFLRIVKRNGERLNDDTKIFVEKIQYYYRKKLDCLFITVTEIENRLIKL